MCALPICVGAPPPAIFSIAAVSASIGRAIRRTSAIATRIQARLAPLPIIALMQRAFCVVTWMTDLLTFRPADPDIEPAAQYHGRAGVFNRPRGSHTEVRRTGQARLS